jgi:hypothetical protein
MPTTFTIDEGAPILVEFTPQPGVVKASRSPAETAEQAAKALDSAMNTIHHMARRATATIDALVDRPSEFELSFGIKLDAEAGAFIAKAGVEASLSVKMTWEREAKPVAVLPPPAAATPAAASKPSVPPTVPTADH